MKILIALLFALALSAPPTAPTGLGIEVQAALVQKLPCPGLGAGYPYYSGDVIALSTGSCPASDLFLAEGTGYAVRAENGDLAGTLVSFADPTADNSSAIAIPKGNQFLSGQAHYRTPVLGAGTFTIWIRSKNGGKIWVSNAPMLLAPTPDPSLITTIPVNTTYQWDKVLPTVAGGAARDVWITADPGLQIDSIYIDLNGSAIPASPGGTVPPAPQYVVLDTAVLPTGVADAKWPVANVVPFTGSDTGMVSAPIVKVLWNSAANKVCVYQEQTSANLLFATAADDDAAILMDSAVLMDVKTNSTIGADTNTARIVVNGHNTPALLDGTFPAGVFSSTTDFANVTRDRSLVGNLLKMMVCLTLPATITPGALTLTNYSSLENVNGTVNTKRAAGTSSFVPAPLSSYAESLLTLWSATLATPPPDTTAPVIGAPTLLTNGTNAQTWTFSCTDSGSGCASATLQYDINSGVPYALSQSGILTGSNPTYTAQVAIAGLTPGTAYFVRGCALDGAGNSACGVEANASTTSPVGVPTRTVNGNTSQTWTFACGGCVSATLQYDVNTGVPYTFTQTATLASGTATAAITGLSQATLYFVRGCGVDGLGNTVCGGEAIGATTGVGGSISITGSGAPATMLSSSTAITTASTGVFAGLVSCSTSATGVTWSNNRGGTGGVTGGTGSGPQGFTSNAIALTANRVNTVTFVVTCSGGGGGSTALDVRANGASIPIVQFGMNEGTGTTVTDSSGQGNNGL